MEIFSEVVCHFEGSTLFLLESFFLLLDEILLVGIFNFLSAEMFELIVLGHKAGQFQRECLDHTRELKHLDKAFRVFLELLWLEFLVDVKVLNAVLQSLYYFLSLDVLALLVNFKVFKQFVSI